MREGHSGQGGAGAAAHTAAQTAAASPGDGAANAQSRAGILAGIACYVIWGMFPAYWKLLGEVAPAEIIVHRIVWSFATMALVVALARLPIGTLLRSARAWRLLVPAALLITANWSIYIWGISIGKVVEAAIGYYLNPLVSILFGVIFFREKLTRVQGLAVVLASAGLVYFTASYGHFPWVALALALSFGAYGVVKKRGAYPAVESLAFENGVMVVPAILFGIWLANHMGTHAFAGDTATAHGWFVTGLLILGGPITALPLVLFSWAANRIPLSMLGFIQFLSPTIQLLLGVFAYGEPFTADHAVLLGCIWTGIVLVMWESLRVVRALAAGRRGADA